MTIRKFVEDYSSEKEADLYLKAKRFIGVAESGIPDLGQNHRKYLVKKIKVSIYTLPTKKSFTIVP
ncbi:MAG: hypothetical protein WAK95_01555 [Desulfobacterales bacterium]